MTNCAIIAIDQDGMFVLMFVLMGGLAAIIVLLLIVIARR